MNDARHPTVRMLRFHEVHLQSVMPYTYGLRASCMTRVIFQGKGHQPWPLAPVYQHIVLLTHPSN